MLRTADGKMNSVTYLLIIACISNSLVRSVCVTNTVELNNTECEISGNAAYQKLEIAEEMIRLAKQKFCFNMQTLHKPMDCEDLFNSGLNKSGVYKVWLKNRLMTGPISVYCDMETDGGGWTVIQRRGNFSHEKDYFFQNWDAYKKGFGNLKEDFWIGNDIMYALSNQKLYSIRFDLGTFDGSKGFAVYNNFWIDDENNAYTLHVSGYTGNVGDSFTHHDNFKFSTRDRDNDVCVEENCAEKWRGAWWFKACVYAHLNGEYFSGRTTRSWEGVMWMTWKGIDESLKTSEMKIREKRSWIK